MNTAPLMPSTENIRLLLSEIEPRSTFVNLRPMGAEGTHPAFVVDAVSATGTPFQLAIKCYNRLIAPNGEARARREFTTLQILQRQGVPVPMAIYLDEHGTHLGTPGIVTSFVTGKQLFALDDPHAAAKQLAQALLRIHDVPITPNEQVWLIDADQEVLWFRNTGAKPDYILNHPKGEQIWDRVERLLQNRHSVTPTFVHTDYWIGQVLWHQNQIAAVLDWEEAGYGDPGYDLAYCAMDLALGPMGPEAAQKFLNVYIAESGKTPTNFELWQWAVIPRVLHVPDWAHACEKQLNEYIEQLKQNEKHFDD